MKGWNVLRWVFVLAFLWVAAAVAMKESSHARGEDGHAWERLGGVQRFRLAEEFANSLVRKGYRLTPLQMYECVNTTYENFAYLRRSIQRVAATCVSWAKKGRIEPGQSIDGRWPPPWFQPMSEN